MISPTVQENLKRFVPAENILLNEPMRKHTTFRVGGEADCVLSVTSADQLGSILKYLNLVELPYFILGNGSNLLVSDSGYQGIIIKTMAMQQIKVEGNSIMAQAGALLSQVAREACENGLTGLEFAAGIPGTIGGAVVMNAGAYEGEMKQVVKQVEVLDKEGNSLEMDNNTMEFGYRTSSIKNNPFVVTQVILELQPGDKATIKAKMDELSMHRRMKQPLDYPSAGSTFKRPEGNYAGKLIMEAGLRGYSIGGAAVSEKHCGFVVNKANALAQDVSDLIDEVRERVYEKFGVRLELEVIKLGKFNTA